MLNPSITTANLKKKHPMHRPQKDLSLTSRRAAKKPLLTLPMMKRSIQFCNDYLYLASADSKTVIFSDESTMRLIRAGSMLVRMPLGSSRYDSKSTVNTLKYPESVMVWGAFSGNNGRWGLFFIPNNTTLAGDQLFGSSRAAYSPHLGHPPVPPLHA